MSSQEPPPYYDAVIAAGNPTQQIPLVIHSLLIDCIRSEPTYIVVQLVQDFYIHVYIIYVSDDSVWCALAYGQPRDCPHATHMQT